MKRLALSALVSFDFQIPIGFYIVDFVFPTKMIIVELDGKSHNYTREYDQRRDRFLSSFGFTVWRIPNPDAGSVDLGRIFDAPNVEGYERAIAEAHKATYSKPIRDMKKDERVEHYQQRQQALTERVHHARRNRKRTDLTPRLIKRCPDDDESPIDIARRMGAEMRAKATAPRGE